MATVQSPQVVIPCPSFRIEVERLAGQKVSACFQCEKCTSGCPVTFAMDILPHRLIRSVHMGLKDEVLGSNAIWVCASCETCTTRCPNGIDIAHVMDTLRQISKRQGIKPLQYSIPIFHSVFLNSIKRHGRAHETEIALTYSVEDAGWFGFLKLTAYGFTMFLKGKVKLRPNRVRAINYIKELFRKAEASL